MDEKTKKRLASLDPKIKRNLDELFSKIDESISAIYDLAIHDEKTGLYNHKFFDTELEMEIEKTERGQQKLSLMITDIDFFKKINDKYGHIKADELLAQLAKVLQKQLRKSDVIARFGGEEFFILLPETNLEKAKRLSSRLKSAIHSDSFLKKHNLNVSGGITQFKKNDSKKSFKSRADKALYEAKRNGRDMFVSIK
ncbi:MAG: GGDEF domain-containing protein [Nanoarchaeota archaeon]